MAKYLHGYSKKEQKRLVQQARIWAPWVHRGIDFHRCRHILEVGCGVGAQTEILLKRFPRLKITGIDISSDQLAVAEQRLRPYVRRGQVTLIEADATQIPVQSRSFDGAFLCWFLEHVPAPDLVLKEVRRKLKSRSPIYCSEVFNSTLFVNPYSPTILKYWFELNDYQWSIQGHPFVGAELGNLLNGAGFKGIETEIRPLLFDSRNKAKRRAFIRYWTDLMLSAAPGLLKAKRISKGELGDLKSELKRVADSPDGVIFYAWVHSFARAP